MKRKLHRCGSAQVQYCALLGRPNLRVTRPANVRLGAPVVRSSDAPTRPLHDEVFRRQVHLRQPLRWMVDRGLISIDYDFRILRAGGVPEDVARLIRPEARLLIPGDETLRPHPSFLRFHRERVFKG